MGSERQAETAGNIRNSKHAWQFVPRNSDLLHPAPPPLSSNPSTVVGGEEEEEKKEGGGRGGRRSVESWAGLLTLHCTDTLRCALMSLLHNRQARKQRGFSHALLLLLLLLLRLPSSHRQPQSTTQS